MSDDEGERLFQRAAESLRGDGAPDPDALAHTISAIRRVAAGERAVGPSTFGDARLVRPLRRRPLVTRGMRRFVAGLAAGLTFAAGVGLGLWAGWRMHAASLRVASRATDEHALGSTTMAGSAPAGARLQSVQFMLVAPAATRVSLVGEFNDWDLSATPMSRASGGAWHVALPLPRGRHVYAFVVDGTSWVADPQAPLAPERWFGASNSVMLVNGERSQ